MDRKTMNGQMTTDRQIKKRTMGGHITFIRCQMDIYSNGHFRGFPG